MFQRLIIFDTIYLMSQITVSWLATQQCNCGYSLPAAFRSDCSCARVSLCRYAGHDANLPRSVRVSGRNPSIRSSAHCILYLFDCLCNFKGTDIREDIACRCDRFPGSRQRQYPSSKGIAGINSAVVRVHRKMQYKLRSKYGKIKLFRDDNRKQLFNRTVQYPS